MNLKELLEELARDWTVELNTASIYDGWVLSISTRDGNGGQLNYVGPLSSVVARAHAGEPPDSRSR